VPDAARVEFAPSISQCNLGTGAALSCRDSCQMTRLAPTQYAAGRPFTRPAPLYREKPVQTPYHVRCTGLLIVIPRCGSIRKTIFHIHRR
jgi:hypothetical protein